MRSSQEHRPLRWLRFSCRVSPLLWHCGQTSCSTRPASWAKSINRKPLTAFWLHVLPLSSWWTRVDSVSFASTSFLREDEVVLFSKESSSELSSESISLLVGDDVVEELLKSSCEWSDLHEEIDSGVDSGIDSGSTAGMDETAKVRGPCPRSPTT